jgi:hypothetical protein
MLKINAIIFILFISFIAISCGDYEEPNEERGSETIVVIYEQDEEDCERGEDYCELTNPTDTEHLVCAPEVDYPCECENDYIGSQFCLMDGSGFTRCVCPTEYPVDECGSASNCEATEICENGQCVHGGCFAIESDSDSHVCYDENPNTEDFCSPLTHQCENVPYVVNNRCDHFNDCWEYRLSLCQTVTACEEGTCIFEAVQCHDGFFCEEETGGCVPIEPICHCNGNDFCVDGECHACNPYAFFTGTDMDINMGCNSQIPMCAPFTYWLEFDDNTAIDVTEYRCIDPEDRFYDCLGNDNNCSHSARGQYCNYSDAAAGFVCQECSNRYVDTETGIPLGCDEEYPHCDDAEYWSNRDDGSSVFVRTRQCTDLE